MTTSMPWDVPPETPSPLRVLFASRLTDAFYEADATTAAAVVEAVGDAFGDLEGRFGVKVLGTMDDDRLVVGGSEISPWTGYILADVADLGTVIGICNLLRETWVGDYRLWKYLRIEARVGRPRFIEHRKEAAEHA